MIEKIMRKIKFRLWLLGFRNVRMLEYEFYRSSKITVRVVFEDKEGNQYRRSYLYTDRGKLLTTTSIYAM